MKNDLKARLTSHLETGTSAWTAEPIIRYPEDGCSVFLELLERHKKVLNYEGIGLCFEAGTWNGCNAADFAAVFDRVISVDVNPNAYDLAMGTHGENKKIWFRLGNAPDALRECLSESPDERMVILLDDHSSHESNIKEELEIIHEHSNVDHIIIVDDSDQLTTGSYPSYETIELLVNQMDRGYEIIADPHNKLLIYVPVSG